MGDVTLEAISIDATPTKPAADARSSDVQKEAKDKTKDKEKDKDTQASPIVSSSKNKMPEKEEEKKSFPNSSAKKTVIKNEDIELLGKILNELTHIQ